VTVNLCMGRFLREPSHVFALLTVGLLLVATAVAAGAYGENLPDYSARPAQRGVDGGSNVRFSHSVESGDRVVDAVKILNHADEPAEFDVYVVDMVASSDGTPTAAARAVPVEGTGTWFAVSVDTIEVHSRDSEIVEFTVDVPEGTPPGDYDAVIMVEAHESIGRGTISTRTRIGLLARITVLADVNLGVTLGDITSRHTDLGIEFAILVMNTGDVTFSTSGFVTVDSWFSDEAVVSQLSPSGLFVAPGEQIHLRGLWTDPPHVGRYDATATVEAVVGERQPVQFVSNATTMWLMPWRIIIVVIAITAIVVWILRATRSSRQERSIRKQEERDLVQDFRRQRDIAGT